MAMKTRATSGFCNTAQLVAEHKVTSSMDADSWHHKCRGGSARPPALVTRKVDGKEVTALEEQEPWRCGCPCHDGQEIEIKPAESLAQTRIKAATADSDAAPVGRNKKLREAMALELQARRFIELDKTGSDSEDHKLVSRIHSAAKSVGLKVRTSCKGEKITGRVV